jgi:quercetin dioxygenase-like cupin family protein
MSAIRCLALLAVLTLVVATRTPADEPKKDHEIITPASIQWQDGPPSLPRGARMAVLEGDPTKEGPFVLRMKLPDGFRIAPHTHPKDERVTVLSGTLHLGLGATFDEKAARAMPAGSYGRTEAGMKHFGWVTGETILQLHGTGPWGIQYVNPDDDPRNKK